MQGGSGAATKHRGWQSSIAVRGSVDPLPLAILFLPCPLPLGAAKVSHPYSYRAWRAWRGVACADAPVMAQYHRNNLPREVIAAMPPKRQTLFRGVWGHGGQPSANVYYDADTNFAW